MPVTWYSGRSIISDISVIYEFHVSYPISRYEYRASRLSLRQQSIVNTAGGRFGDEECGAASAALAATLISLDGICHKQS